MEPKGASDSANGVHGSHSTQATPEGVDRVQIHDERVSCPTMHVNPIPNLNGRSSDPTTNGYTSNHMDGSNALEAKHAVNGNAMKQDGEAPPPIAIVGMGMRLPGGINGETEFWDMLINKKNGRCLVPEDRYNVEAFYDPSGRPGTVKSKHGYFLNHVDIQHLDTSFFSMNRKEVEKLDPQQKLLLEVVWECMENAGQVGWRGKNIGCYVGVFGEDWLDMAAKDPQHLGMYRITGSGDFAISNRVSYEYDLTGPSMTIRTACSSALIGLHEACQAIYNGDCHSAIIAGTNLILSPTMTVAMTEQGVLSPTGLCKTFDADADGYVRGEAINAVYIKKLTDAIHDGDPIRAVIRATAINSDGKTPGMAYPSSERHEMMMRRAYQVARLPDLSQTAYVECHGTGTAIGDPLEVTAIANVFGQHGVYIGSVKPNVGHSEGASGITSLIKAVLALEHRVIPPNINFSKPNPKIPFEKAKLQVPLEGVPWPENRPRASVNSFGIGGANAHIVLESASSLHERSTTNEIGLPDKRRSHLLVFSAGHPESLKHNIANQQHFIEQNPHLLKDLAYTLGARREHLAHRAFCVTDGTAPLRISPATRSKSAGQTVLVFTGQGAQWAGMAKQLWEDFDGFRRDIQDMDDILAGLPYPPSWQIQEELLKSDADSRINQVEFSQPLCTALQIGIVNLFRTWGIAPAAVVGHSSGEIAAAYATNAITARSAIILAYYRGQVSKLPTRAGGMLAVGMGRGEVTPYLIEGVVIACENSPENVTLSGDQKQINQVAMAIAEKQPATLVRHLKVGTAYHSHHMEEVVGRYYDLISDHVPTFRMDIPFYSSVTGKALDDSNRLGPSYWRQNLESPVLFHSAIRTVLEHLPQASILVEVGPHSALAGPLRQIFKSLGAARPPPVYLPTLVRGQHGTADLLTTLGQMHLLNVPLNFDTATPGKEVLTNLPTYAWHHDARLWDESRVTREWRLRKFPSHELLGSRILEGSDLEPTWRNLLDVDGLPWLQHHKVFDDVVFPAAGYITMVGEAIRQLSGSDAFSLHHSLIKTALVLQDSSITEIMTCLRQVRLTTALHSEWYEFTISTFNGTAWVEHCIGQVGAGRVLSAEPQRIDALPRKVPTSSWYSTMRKIGLNYGEAFQALTDISAEPNCATAAGSFTDGHRSSSTSYQLHPTSIDSCLQLFNVGISDGIARRLERLYVPTAVEDLYICQGAPEMRARIKISRMSKSSVDGDAIVMAGSTVVMEMKGVHFSLLEDQGSDTAEDSVAGARLQWRPDIDVLPASQLMRPLINVRDDIVKLERLTLLCILETRHQLVGSETKLGYLEKFQAWLDMQADQAATGTYPLIEDACDLTRLSHDERLRSIQTACAAVQDSRGAEVGKVVQQVLDNCAAVFSQQVDPIDVLMKDDGLRKIYDFSRELWDCREFFELLGHAKPTLKILEIGAGTGGTSAGVLDCLMTQTGGRMYSEYCYTDISAGFFVAAQERFKAFPNVDYKVLDISKDPMDQGFQPESYDLIVASNVLHATPSIHTTLGHVRKLLHPRGRLFLQELRPTTRTFNYIMGILPGWWLGELDDRPYQPNISVERWDLELQATGFSGVESVVIDEDQSYQTNVNIVSGPATATQRPKAITLLCDDRFSAVAEQVEAIFVRKGYRLNYGTINDLPPADQDIVSVMDLTAPFFDGISPDRLRAFQDYVGNLGSSGVLWITKSSQIDCKNPRYSQILGVARTIRSELLTEFATVEIDKVDEATLEAVTDVFAKFQRRSKEQDLDPDWEYAVVDGRINIPRYRWISVADELLAIPSQEEELPRKLLNSKAGSLQSLQWIQGSPIALAPDEIDVETVAVGLNFKDILVCMGVVEATKDGLGLEGAGVVQSVGQEVKDFVAGDRVMMFEHGCFSTRVAMPAKLCTKIPDDLSFEEAATLPCVYGTVIHSLLTTGRLEKGQTILIQSACGGVGLAAIQICQMIGAEIFATVGNEEKVQHLMRTFGIARNRIFNSRNSGFLADVKRETNGRGVDVVLNSLSGELLHASWECVAEYGKMLEIGKRDFIGRGKLSMDLFEANRAFFGIDLARLCVERVEKCRLLLDQCIQLYRQGLIGPIKPMKVFEATKIVEAFKYMQKGQHIGKIVVTMPKSPQDLSVTAVKQDFHLRSEGSYLLVGGLGGLGKAIATWMVERGARHLIFLSRSAGKGDGDQEFIRELEAQGCLVRAVCGSVDCLEDVENTVMNTSVPIAGVIHMSMVLRDRKFLEFTHQEWHAAIAPKVEGAWNLHRALLGKALDFFILFSTISAVVGQPGQANYAAANTFLDSFVQYRHSVGLPASAINIGAVEDVGYVSQNPAILEQFKATSTHTLREQDLIDTVQLMMTKHPTIPSSRANEFQTPMQLVIGLRTTRSLSDPSNRAIWKRDIRMSQYRNLEDRSVSTTGVVNEDLKHFLAAVVRQPSMLNDQSNVEFLTRQIGNRLYNFMLRPEDDMDVKQSPSALGVDSLVAIEIRNWWRQSLGLEISVLEIMNCGSIEQMGRNAADGLQRKHGALRTSDEDTYLLMKAP